MRTFNFKTFLWLPISGLQALSLSLLTYMFFLRDPVLGFCCNILSFPVVCCFLSCSEPVLTTHMSCLSLRTCFIPVSRSYRTGVVWGEPWLLYRVNMASYSQRRPGPGEWQLEGGRGEGMKMRLCLIILGSYPVSTSVLVQVPLDANHFYTFFCILDTFLICHFQFLTVPTFQTCMHHVPLHCTICSFSRSDLHLSRYLGDVGSVPDHCNTVSHANFFVSQCI